MEKLFNDQAIEYADALTAQIEMAIPGCRVNNMGFRLLVHLANKSCASILPLTSTSCDVNATDCLDQEYDTQAMNWDDAVKFLKDMAALKADAIEQTSSGNVSPSIGLDRPFAAKGQPSNRALEQSHREGWTNIDKNKLRESTVPSAIYGKDLFTHLKEVLPLGEKECYLDDAGNFIIAVDVLKVRVMAVGLNLFTIQAWIGEKAEPTQVQMTYGDTVKCVFDLASLVERSDRSATIDDVEDHDETAESVLLELAESLGQSTDLFRNKNLFDLRSGLSKKNTNQNHAGTGNALLSGLDGHLKRFSALRHQSPGLTAKEAPAAKAKWFRGHPVALSENGMDGKVLTYFPDGIGAVIVDKKEVPVSDKLKLSWDDNDGAVLIPLHESTMRPSWKSLGTRY
jgi:hypothetical protein